MSLIQQALEKTSRAQETRTTTPPVQAPPVWERDPMGASLEQELTQVQQKHVRRRSLRWKVLLGALLVCFVAGLSYMGIREIPFGAKPASAPGAFQAPIAPQVPAESQSPVESHMGNIYRLTGVIDFGGKTIAVINDRFWGVGDTVDGKAYVRKIGDGEVLLDIQGQMLKLRL